MHIAIDGKRYFTNRTGLGRYSRLLVRSLLSDSGRNDMTITLFKPRGRTVFEAPEQKCLVIKEAAYKLPGDLGNGLWRWRTLPGLLDGGDYDLFHGPSNGLPNRANLPMIVTITDLIFIRYPNYFPLWDRNYYFCSFKQAAEKARMIIAISEATKSDIVNFFNIPEKKIEVIYPGFESHLLKYHHEEAENVCDLFRLPERYILAVGTLEPRKNALRLAQAFDQLLQQRKIGKDTGLVFAGRKGWFYREILRKIDSLPSRSSIHFIDEPSDSQLAALYQSASVMAYISEFEGYGYPVLEAMSFFLPLLLSRVASLPEIAGDAAVYVDPYNTESIAEGLFRLLDDEHLRYNLSQGANKRLVDFSAEKMAEKTVKLYRKVVEGK